MTSHCRRSQPSTGSHRVPPSRAELPSPPRSLKSRLEFRVAPLPFSFEPAGQEMLCEDSSTNPQTRNHNHDESSRSQQCMAMAKTLAYVSRGRSAIAYPLTPPRLLPSRSLLPSSTTRPATSRTTLHIATDGTERKPDPTQLTQPVHSMTMHVHAAAAGCRPPFLSLARPSL